MRNADVIFGNEVQVWGRNAVVGVTPYEELYAYDQSLDWNAILSAAAGLDLASSAAAPSSTSIILAISWYEHPFLNSIAVKPGRDSLTAIKTGWPPYNVDACVSPLLIVRDAVAHLPLA